MKTRQFYFLLAGLLASTGTHAQQPDLKADEVVVTATRFEEKSNDQPIGVSIITGEEIRNSGETSLPRILAHQAGVFVRDNSGSPDMQVDLRGFGLTGDQNTLVLLDGRRLSEYELTTARWSSIPIESIDRIEIVRGSGAVLYGGGATGGVINIITKGAAQNSKSFDAYGAGGSYDTQDYRIGGQIAGDSVGLNLNGGHFSSDNYRENNRVVQDNFVADVRTLDPNRNIALKMGYDKQDLRLPGNRTETELETDRRGTRNPTDFSNREGGFANLSGKLRVGEAEFLADIGYREKKNDFHALLGTSSLDGNTKVETWTVSPRVKIPYSAFGEASSFITGIDWEDWDYTSSRTNPAEAAATQRNSAIYVQNTFGIARGTNLSLGGRLQRIEFEASDSPGTLGSVSDEQNRNVSAYEIGARHQFNDNTAAYGKYGYSFRVAMLDEIYSPGFGAFFIPPSISFLEPQTSHDSEVGFETSIGPGRYRVALHRSDIKKEIHFDSSAFANVNLPPTKRTGVEVEGKWMLVETVSLFANYTYTEAKFRSAILGGVDVSGNRIPLVPRHLGNIGLDWTIAQQTRVNATAIYVGSQLYDGDELNTFRREIPSYWTADLGLFHSIENWTIGASVRNLFDKKYYTYALALGPPTNFVAYPAPERNFLVSAQYRFGK
jgi:iron complex outermembrane receptor protein